MKANRVSMLPIVVPALALMLWTWPGVAAVTFTDIGAGLPGADGGTVAWGDYDNDGDLDLLLTGGANPGTWVARIYRNDGGTFTDVAAGLPGVYWGGAAWGDFDNDGDLDLAIAGEVAVSTYIARIYRNDGGSVFTDIAAGLPGLSYSSVAWGDYDNDGDLDLLLTGKSGPDFVAWIYRNDNSVFTDIGAGLPGVDRASVAWGDYDNDEDLDLILAGRSSLGDITRVYRNDDGVFTDIGAGLPGVEFGSVAWGDYDNDGDLDLLLTGGGGRTFRIYRNDGGTFSDIAAGLPGVIYSAAAWGDMDNDGDQDVAVSGISDTGQFTRIYRNDGDGVFTDTGAGLQATDFGDLAWGDYDNDGDLDLAVLGMVGASSYTTRIYASNGAPANTPPGAPGGLSGTLAGTDLVLRWNPATDAQSPAAGLTYNIRVGTTPGGSEIVSAMASAASGFRRVPRLGNAQERLSWKVRVPDLDSCYWSVQAVDGAFAGSPFAAEQVVRAVAFTDALAGLPAVSSGAAAWGDYDGDGDLDIALSGDAGFGYISRVYRNDAGSFTDIGAGLTGVYGSSLAWGDYDNDGDLDLLLMGDTGAGWVACVYRNDGGSFVDIGAGLPGTAAGSAAWGDYDNDGDLDLLMAGSSGASRITSIFRNDGGTFTDIAAGLPGLNRCGVAWGDYDNDGDLDILMTGNSATGYLASVYRNDAGTFVDANAGLAQVGWSMAAWGDYDADGDLDIVLAGDSGVWPTPGDISRVYRNDGGGVFTDISAGLQGVEQGVAAWGDYDSDGDLDLLVAGSYTARVYCNLGADVFVDAAAGLSPVFTGAGGWGDYDNDGDLDLLVTATGSARVYRSDGAPANTPPAAPTGLSASATGLRLAFSWNPAADAQTPTSGLSYNLRVGTTPGGSEVASPMADAGTGRRRIVQPGNAQERTAWTLTLPHGGDYYFTVQALDGVYAGSPFSAPESVYVIGLTDIDAGLPGVYHSTVDWGDYDSDGDLDLVLSGYTGSEHITRVYRNDGDGAFTDIMAGLPGVAFGTALWGDYDSDGDLDLVLLGEAGLATYITRVYRNDGAGTFTDVGAGLPGVFRGGAAWGDFDNDGDLDLALAGITGPARIAGVYRNDGGGVFTDIAAGLPGADFSAMGWGDYDGDGDLDLVLTGVSNVGRISRIYRNDGAGGFTDIAADLPGVEWGAVAWGDFDNDGDLDLALAGSTGGTRIARVYRNDGGDEFTDIAAGLAGVTQGAVRWGDVDNDGDLDLALAGDVGGGRVVRVYRNDGGGFNDMSAGLPGIVFGAVAWGDYDYDGDLDLALTGLGPSAPMAGIYSCDGVPSNTPPEAPTGLSASAMGSQVVLSWNASTDDRTPTAGLSYNVRAVVPPGATEAGAAMADSGSGYRRVVQLGNAQERTSWTLTLPDGMYYFQVQAVDGAYAGSPFSSVGTLSSIVGAPGEAPPVQFALHASAPNPFGGATSMAYDLAETRKVRIEIYDVQGRQVKRLVAATLPAGRYHADWDGTDSRGRRVAAGAYLCRMRAGAFQVVRRVVLIR